MRILHAAEKRQGTHEFGIGSSHAVIVHRYGPLELTMIKPADDPKQASAYRYLCQELVLVGQLIEECPSRYRKLMHVNDHVCRGRLFPVAAQSCRRPQTGSNP
jgi:hypothetical protein